MRKLFGNFRKSVSEEEYEDWNEEIDFEEYIEDEEYYAEDEEPEEVEYYAEGEEPEEVEYYAEGEEPEEVEYYEEGEEPEEVEYYEEGEEPEEVEYYAEGEEPEEVEYYEEGEEAEEVEYYAEGEEPEEVEYYAEGEDFEEVEYYAEGEESEEVEYYAESEEPEEVEYYAEDEEAEYYADGEDFEEAEYYIEGEEAEYYTEGAEFEEAEYYAEDEEYYEEEERVIPFGRKHINTAKAASKPKKQISNQTFLGKAWNVFLSMGAMDKVITVTGVAVLVLAIVTGSVYASAKMLDKQVSGFVTVGSQLEDIDLIGEQGLLAVADAEKAKRDAANAVTEEKQEQTTTEYEEQEYNKAVVVNLSMTSIQKDLKIKFVNQKTGKLIANVPFQVTVTNADGEALEWEDDDMDGIIYKKGIKPGSYKVSVKALTGDKYKDYTLPGFVDSVEVKKDIEYKKVDVSNEIKSEAEVNVSKEDTKVNATQVENQLQNTVTWVESTSSAGSYQLVDKSTIPDPATLAYTGSFTRLAREDGIDDNYTMGIGSTKQLEVRCAGINITGIIWESSNPTVAKVDSNGKVTAIGHGTATISYKASGNYVSSGDAINQMTGSCKVTVKGNTTVSLENTAPTVAVGAQISSKIITSGFAANKALKYEVKTANTAIADVEPGDNGHVIIKGIAVGSTTLTVKVQYADAANENSEPVASTTVNVTVTDGMVITLDKTAVTAYVGKTLTINAAITNAAENTALTVESSDNNIATAEVNGKAIKIIGVRTGSATVTVKCEKNGQEVRAVCTVTVKADPKQDRTNKLKDINGTQLYVKENGEYREAVYADYYTMEEFYIQSGLKYTGWQTIDGKVYYFDEEGNKVTGEQIIQGAKYNFGSDGVLNSGSGSRGIDVSKWNGNIDWSAVKNSGVEYVIIRCGYRGSSQGALIKDPKYEANIQGATAAGLKIGVYFFTQAVDEAEAIEEASMVLDLVKGYNIAYPVFLDVEPSNGRGDRIDSATRTAVCKAFCKTIQEAGYTAGIYANKTWLTEKMDVGQLSAYKIWLAQYAETPTYTGRYDLWQYQSTGKVSGISGDVDMNWSYLGY